MLHEDELVKRPPHSVGDDAGATLLHQRERILDLEHEVAMAKANADLRSRRTSARADRRADRRAEDNTEGGGAGRAGSGVGGAGVRFGDEAVGQSGAAAAVAAERDALTSENHQVLQGN